MARGGFDVIIGNPPYVEWKDVKQYSVLNYLSFECGDLYAVCVERCLAIVSARSRLGLILPISIFGTDGFSPLQRLVLEKLSTLWVSSFANRPAQLFEGAQKRLSIVLGKPAARDKAQVHTAAYLRWKREERDPLFPSRVKYASRSSHFVVFPASLEKLGSHLECRAFARIVGSKGNFLDGLLPSSKHVVYYTRKFGYFLAFLDRVPAMYDLRTGRKRLPSELKTLAFRSRDWLLGGIAALSSSTFFWFWNVLSDCRNLNRRDLIAFPASIEEMKPALVNELVGLGTRYLQALNETSTEMVKSGLRIETFDYGSCKPIIDDIDRVLAKHYGFTNEELDFIINYDIKYRMGADAGGGEEEE
jgi:hypothetical protein